LARDERWPAARAAVDRLALHVDDDPELLVECAHICLGAEDRRRALELYQEALADEPDRIEWLLQVARIASNVDEIEIAKGAAERLIELEENPEARAMLAAIAHRQSDLEAVARHLDAIPEDSDQAANAANLLGMLQVSQAKIREGLDNMARTDRLAPDAFPLQATRVMYLNYDPDISREALREAHAAIGRRFRHALAPLDPNGLGSPPDPDRRLRIGFVSPDLRAHSVTYFIRPYFNAFDRDRFDVVAYAHVASEDTASLDLRGLATEWRNVYELSDQKLAERIREDKIDILIDLAGLTRSTRLLAFTARPAPIQMTHIGYPNSTGLPAIDYRITDGIADPEGADEDYVETLIRLPRCFLNYGFPLHAPPLEPGPREHRDHITFGSFNNFAKINDEVLAVWAETLLATPESRLLLKSTTSGDPVAQAVIRDGLSRRGVDPKRVRFSQFRESPQGHLAVYNDVDVALDTFPYNGTTTTCEALWMGAPVITLKGDRHASRVGASLLTAIGFEAGIAESRDDYVLTARLLAENPGLLKTARRSLRDAMMRSPLCDAEAHARTLEEAFRAVWRIWCEEGPEAPGNLRAAPPLL
jgi:predicted O-linked N-acetylglucosamine transferase (SPINDLY family)